MVYDTRICSRNMSIIGDQHNEKLSKVCAAKPYFRLLQKVTLTLSKQNVVPNNRKFVTSGNNV